MMILQNCSPDCQHPNERCSQRGECHALRLGQPADAFSEWFEGQVDSGILTRGDEQAADAAWYAALEWRA